MKAAAWLLAAAGAGGIGAAELGLLLRVPAVESWFFTIAWYSYILMVDGAVHLRTGRSLLLSRPLAFLELLPWSCAFWLLFELANLRIENWYYVGLPPEPGARLAGTAVAFATVLPALLETAELLRSFRFAARLRCDRLVLTPGLLRWIQLAGAAGLAAALFWPRHAFPLVWIAPLLLLEPWLARRRRESFLVSLAGGDLEPLCRWLAAGAACGLLWEFWNWWARARWIYTVPFFQDARLFEMPLLGFLGFPPFALVAGSFVRLLAAADLCRAAEGDHPAESPAERGKPATAPRWWPAAGLACAMAFSVPSLFLVDAATVRGTLPLAAEIPGIPAELAARLAAAGLRETRDLLRAARSRGPMPASVDAAEIQPLLPRAELMEVRLLGARGAAWLRGAGVETVPALASGEPGPLLAAMLSANAGPPPLPTAAEVANWIRGAREALRPGGA